MNDRGELKRVTSKKDFVTGGREEGEEEGGVWERHLGSYWEENKDKNEIKLII